MHLTIILFFLMQMCFFFLYTSSPLGILRNKTLEHQENVARKLLFEMLEINSFVWKFEFLFKLYL